MTANDLKQDVKIPKWVVVIVIPLLPILIGSTLNTIINLTTTNNNVNYNRERININVDEIKNLQKNKANINDVNRNYELLKDINGKLDNYILKNTK